jgi:hypothetical protein
MSLVWCDARNAPALDPWSDLLGCHVGVRADVLRGMPVGIPAWQGVLGMSSSLEVKVFYPT